MPAFKPSFPAKVNYSHPLTRGLRFAALLNDRNLLAVRELRYGRTATVNATPAWVDNSAGPAMSFSGSSVDWPNSPEYGITGSAVSVCVGFRFTASQTNAVLLAKWGASGSYILFVDNISANRLKGGVSIGASAKTATSANTYNDGLPHQAVMTYDGAAVKLYVDGGREEINTAQTGNIDTTTEVLRLAAYSGGGGGFVGEINYGYVWARALPRSEVAELFFDPYGMFLQRMVAQPAAVPSSFNWNQAATQIARMERVIGY